MNSLKVVVIIYCLTLPGFFIQAEESLIQSEPVLIDEIKCVVCGPEANSPFTDTDVSWKRSLDNKFISLDQQMQREIVSQQLVADKIPMDPLAVEKYIEGIKKQNNFSETDLEKWFSEVGRTMQEGLDALASQYQNEYFLHFKFKSQLVPTDDEVQEYYENHPDFIDGYYEVRAARVDFDQENYDQVEQEVNKIIANPDAEANDIAWSEPVRWLDEDINANNKFITDMPVGSIKALPVDNVFELYQLIDYKPTEIIPLDKRKTSIVDALNRKKLEKMLSDYNQSINEYIDVITFDPEDNQLLKN